MDDDEIPFLRAGTRVADDRLGREVGLGVEVIDPDWLEVETAQLGPDATDSPGQLLERREQAARIDHRRNVVPLPLDHVGDGVMALSEERAMDSHKAVGGATAAVHLGEVQNLHPCEGDKSAQPR